MLDAGRTLLPVQFRLFRLILQGLDLLALNLRRNLQICAGAGELVVTLQQRFNAELVRMCLCKARSLLKQQSVGIGGVQHQ